MAAIAKSAGSAALAGARRSAWLVDCAVGVFAGAVAVTQFQTPPVSFDAALLALIIIVLSAILMLSALVTLSIVSRYALFLERWGGRGFLVLLLGVVCFNGQAWRQFCAFLTIAIGFAYLVASCMCGQEHPRSAMRACGGGGAAAAAAEAPPAAAVPAAAPAAKAVRAPPKAGANPFSFAPPAEEGGDP